MQGYYRLTRARRVIVVWIANQRTTEIDMAIDKLQVMRAKLVDRRRVEAFRVAGEHHDVQIAKLNSVHTAIQALEAVIAEEEASAPSVYEKRGFSTL
jgi:hypothetical protein